MKWSILVSWFFIAPLGLAEARYSRPELSGQTQVGRLTLYKSALGVSWFAPIAFRPQFSCANSSGEATSCHLQVINALTISERNQISALMSEEGLKITHFTSIDDRVVSQITESFQALPENLGGRELLSRTLDLSDGRTPYASIAFRVPKRRAMELQDEFAHEGLGRFVVRFGLHAQRLLNYLAFQNGACVRDTVLLLRDKSIGFRDVRSLSRKLMEQCDFKFVGMEREDADAAAHVYVRDRLFKGSRWGGFQIDSDAVQSIGDSFLIYNTIFPVDMACEAVVELKDGAQPKFECTETGQ